MNDNGATNSLPVITKWCGKCGRYLPLDDFSNDRTHRDGKAGNCRDCRGKYYKEEYYPANRESLIEKAKRRNKERRKRLTLAALNAKNDSEGGR